MVRLVIFLVFLGLSCGVASHMAHASKGKDILVHVNALLCKDQTRLDAGISAWQSRNLEMFDAYLDSGDCFLTKSTAKGTLLGVRDGRATIVIDYFLIQAYGLNVPAGTELWAMVGTYSNWPENWATR